MDLSKLFERGDLVFTKKFARGPEKGAFTVTTKTPIAALVMGGTHSTHEWNDKTLSRSLASLGLFYSDDIRECIGDVSHKKLIKFLEKKYAND